MVRCYSCHINDAIYKCIDCGYRICKMCSIYSNEHKHLCTGCLVNHESIEELHKDIKYDGLNIIDNELDEEDFMKKVYEQDEDEYD